MAGIGIRRGRHTRNRAFSSTTSASSFSQQSQSQAHLAIGSARGSYDGGALGVDPMTLDPDEALTRLSVREVQAVEEKLRHAHENLAAKLRTLVAERYREMLGTANTLMDMGESSTKLVERLDAAQELIERAAEEREKVAKEGERTSPERSRQDISDIDVDEVDDQRVFAIAAATKLVSEAPDEVWRAIDIASSSSSAATSSASPSMATTLAAEAEFKAATVLRAAWIYTLARATWDWLSSSPQARETVDHFIVDEQFPYVAKQWSSLSPMSSSISKVAKEGLVGWLEDTTSRKGKGKMPRWDDVSATFASTTTSLVSMAIHQGLSLPSALETMLAIRHRNMTHQLARLVHALSRGDIDSLIAAQRLSFLIRVVADTMLHALQLFALPSPSSAGEAHDEPYLLALLGRLVRPIKSKGQAAFPPMAIDVIQTMPSSTLLAAHLPDSIKTLSPEMTLTDDGLNSSEALSKIDKWAQTVESTEIREDGNVVNRLVGRLSSLVEVGEVHIRVEDQLRRAIKRAQRDLAGGSGRGDTLRAKCVDMLEKRLGSLSKAIQLELGKRMEDICRDRANGLAQAVAKGAREALVDEQASLALDGGRRGKGSNDAFDPLSILFEPEASPSRKVTSASHIVGRGAEAEGVGADEDDDEEASCRSDRVEVLASRLSLRSRRIDGLLAFTENKARIMVGELRAYESMMASHRQRKTEEKLEDGERGGNREQRQDIEKLYRGAAKTASEEILKSFQGLMKDVVEPKSIPRDSRGGYRIGEEEHEAEKEEESTDTAQLLLLSRITSGLAQSRRLTDALSPRNLATEFDHLQLRHGLDDIRRACLEPWKGRVVDDALKNYFASGRKEAAATASQSNEGDWPVKPSSRLVGALSFMTQALQMAGCASQDELMRLSRQLLDLFSERITAQRRGVSGSAEERFDDAVLGALKGILGSASGQDSAIKGDERWQDHIEKHVRASLVPIRLLVAPFTVGLTAKRVPEEHSLAILWGDKREKGGAEPGSRVPSISRLVDAERAEPVALLPVT
ncbi:hypothetical protein FA10DRAFT_304268 [Acaromyces ingoldii]|uniref:Conserved oligomeric Golgi complex subunit 1 n=1 Tax=Acaromyces ingoldii TaxID=215250 RepID=A0A316YDC1_9BASI|nr:hypothetical protein FA10DRAFT_304268 [Acaromyces ingoldii]PWN87506.1 hypothetical protein FA10DRAFT_304268 [Acaromyces ingoldii]